jgi:membrane protease YdiL (CAAX protease family)
MDDQLNDKWNRFGERHPSRKIQLIEASVLLFLIMPSMFVSLSVIKRSSLTFPQLAGSSLVHDLALLALVLYLVWRNGEPFTSIGLNLKEKWRELFLGLALFVPFFLGVGLIERLLRSLGYLIPKGPPAYLTPSGAGQFLLAFALLIVVAVTEEVIFRGYFILRLESVLRNSGVAVLLSALVFSIGHGYQGPGSVIAIGLMGIFFGLIYLWRRNLIAPIVIHFLQNFLAMIVAPLAVGSGGMS